MGRHAPIDIIGIIGSSRPTHELRVLARETASRLAQEGITIICGGLGGIMEAACCGAKQAGGLTIGILPGSAAKDANPYVDIPIPTGIGEARNLIIIKSSPAVIAIGGGCGTLSEIAFALKTGVTVIGLNTWNLRDISSKDLDIIEAQTPEEAVAEAKKIISKKKTV